MSDFSTKLEQQIRSLGVSPQGEHFLMKALYPPGLGTQVSIPDSSWHPTMRFDARPSMSAIAPVGLATATWDCLIICPPGDVTGAYVVSASAGTDFRSATAPAHWTASRLTLPPAGASPILRTYYCVDRILAGTATANTRYGYCNPLGITSFRTTYRGVTCHNVSSELYNGGTLVCGQVAVNSQEPEGWTAAPRNAVAAVFTPVIANVPMDETGITSMCPGAQMTEARDGFFMPLRLLGPTQSFCEESGSLNRVNQSAGAGYAQSCISAGNGTLPSSATLPAGYFPSAGNSDVFPWWSVYLQTINGSYDDTQFDQCATGVAIFRGLPPQASLSIQMHVGIEAVVDVTSPFRTLAAATATYDPKAMLAYYEIVSGMPFSYPASYNSLATLLPYLSAAVQMLRSHGGPFLGKLLRAGAAYADPRPQPRSTVRLSYPPPQPREAAGPANRRPRSLSVPQKRRGKPTKKRPASSKRR